MKNMLIIIVCAATASIVVTLITRSLGVESSGMIGGCVGGAIGAAVGLKLYAKQTNQKVICLFVPQSAKQGAGFF